MKNTKSGSFLLFILLITGTLFPSLGQDRYQPLAKGQLWPSINVVDYLGLPISNEGLKGKKTLFVFFRNIGCPICNFHMHQLLENDSLFKAKRLNVIGVYESSAENIRQYIANEHIPFTLIPDPERNLYKRFVVNTSFWRGLNSFFFHGALGKARKGQKLFNNKIKQDGDMNQLTADFLIDENGRVVEAHYGKYLGDHLSIEKVKQFIN